MMVGYKRLGAVLGAVAIGMLTLTPAAVDAQAPGPDRDGFISYSPIFWSFDGRGGIAIPAGDLSNVADAGPTIGAGFAYFLNPRFALRLDGNLDLLQSKDDVAPEAPKLRAWHYTGGFEVHLAEPSESNLLATLDLGAGGVTYHSDSFSFDREGGGRVVNARFRETYFGLRGGLRLGVHLGERARSGAPVATLFVGGSARLLFGKEEDTEFLAELLRTDTFDTVWIFPVEGGIRINIP